MIRGFEGVQILVRGDEEVLTIGPGMGQADVWACCLVFAKGERATPFMGSWWMQRISGGGGARAWKWPRRTDRTRRSATGASGRPTMMTTTTEELVLLRVGHGRYRAWSMEQQIEYRVQMRGKRRSVPDGVQDSTITVSCFAMGRAGIHRNNHFSIVTLGSRRSRKGTILRVRLMWILEHIQQRSSGPLCVCRGYAQEPRFPTLSVPRSSICQPFQCPRPSSIYFGLLCRCRYCLSVPISNPLASEHLVRYQPAELRASPGRP